MGFAINETLFIIDCDDDSESILSIGEKLADGIEIGEDTDRGEEFNFYVSEDGCFNILAVAPNIAERWLSEKYLPSYALQKHFIKNEQGEDELACYLLISPTSQVISRITDARAHGSERYARMVAAAIWHSRQIDPFINLRDGILCELYGVVLPTFTKAPHVADIALFSNILRGQYDEEDLRTKSDFADGKGGLNRITQNECFNHFNYEFSKVEPFFNIGESVDDFVKVTDGALITGPLELNEHYQIYATNGDKLLLVMTAPWAKQLVEHNLLLKMDIASIQVAGTMLKVIALDSRYAVESLANRHYGIHQSDAFNLALAIRRTRSKFPQAKLTNALYLQKLGLILPVDFDSVEKDSAQGEDLALIRDCVTTGPFALSPFLNDVMLACLAIVRG